MIEQQIQLLQNNYKNLNLQNSFDELQINQLLEENKYYEYLKINNRLNDEDSDMLAYKFRNLNQLIGLKINFLISSQKNQFTMQKLGQSLTFLNNLNFLYLDLTASKILVEFEYIFINFGKDLSSLNKLQLMSLTIYDASYIQIELVKSISKGLSNLKKLINLEFNLEFNNGFEDTDIITELFTCFEFLDQLKSLSLTFQSGSNLGDSGLNQVSNKLKFLVNLEIFDFQIKEKNKISENGMKKLKDSILNLKNLNQIKININDKYMDHQEAIKFVDGILELEKLIDFQSKFYLQLNIKEEDKSNQQKNNLNIENNLINISQSLKNISFYIEYRSFDKNNTCLEKCFTNWIYNFNNLELFKSNISLFFDQYNQHYLDKEFFFPQQLKQLTITFSGIDNEIHQQMIFQKIKKLVNLEKLELNIDFNLFSENIKIYFNQCFKNLTQLKELIINQLNNYSKRNDSLPYFAQSLQYLKELTRLDLKINTETCLSSFSVLSKSFQGLQNLKCLNLQQNEFGYNKITKQMGINYLNAIIQLNNISELTINIAFTQNELQQVYKEFSNILQKLQKLRKLDLCQTFKSYNLNNYGLMFMSKRYPRLVEIVKQK